MLGYHSQPCKTVVGKPLPLREICKNRGLVHGEENPDNYDATHLPIKKLTCNSRNYCDRINRSGSAVPNVCDLE